jgi:hypothetical protein
MGIPALLVAFIDGGGNKCLPVNEVEESAS